ncbi:Acetylcholine receptor subunit alpha-L1 [Portunus trituberculatus]|uniref:Acetylcholine receptor subunit alpha-L1 n=1 Tax=Portunus trituberculatus TaxID=210409 RepID=A0A5B7J4Q4_PORTR|nr:Acetylcholine receptor subunit alpha-L1 [Portunus trituberculatus]
MGRITSKNGVLSIARRHATRPVPAALQLCVLCKYVHVTADDYTRGYMQSKAMVGHQGKVFWPPPTKFRSTCPVDVTYFPFDDQTCILKLGSWIYDGFQVREGGDAEGWTLIYW